MSNRIHPGTCYALISLLLTVSSITSVIAQDTVSDVDDKYRNINENYKNPDVDVWVQRFEGEGRQAYDYRNQLVEAIGLVEGQVVADVGAGTGLFEPLLAARVGNSGSVYAVDIVPEFIEHIQKKSREHGLKNIHTVLSDERSTRLKENSVDVVYICDAYHHFVYYKDMLKSIHDALKPGGQLFMVEFDKIPGQSSQWLIDHIRGTKEEFTAEITASGFVLGEEIHIEGLNDTFVIRFYKN